MIRDTTTLEKALTDLLWYRNELGLEAIAMCDMLWIDPETYSICSKPTFEVACTLLGYVTTYSCVLTASSATDMAKDIAKWAETTYTD